MKSQWVHSIHSISNLMVGDSKSNGQETWTPAGAWTLASVLQAEGVSSTARLYGLPYRLHNCLDIGHAIKYEGTLFTPPHPENLALKRPSTIVNLRKALSECTSQPSSSIPHKIYFQFAWWLRQGRAARRLEINSSVFRTLIKTLSSLLAMCDVQFSVHHDVRR
jgi:hypothetical protein